MAEEVGFEPTVELPPRLISSQVPSTAQPLFRCALDGRALHMPYRRAGKGKSRSVLFAVSVVPGRNRLRESRNTAKIHLPHPVARL
jgi:hypothetical protein